MFADDTNFFYSHENKKGLIYTANLKFEKISQWFKANKLSISIKTTKFTLFHKNSLKDEIPLKLPTLMVMIGNNNVERKSSIELLGVILDEHISSTDHVRTFENKVEIKYCLLYCLSQFLHEDSIKTV